MKQKSVDRRVQRTQQLLRESLMELILEKGYEAVTVQDILDRANFGRSTFYSHYRDKDDLLLSGFDQLRTMFEEHNQALMSDKTGGKEFHCDLSLALFRHAQKHHLLYKAMVGKQSGHMILSYVRTYLSDLMRERLAILIKDKKSLPVPMDIVVHWLVSSFLSLLTWWLDRKLPYTPEKMDEIFKQLTMPGVEAVLGFKIE